MKVTLTNLRITSISEESAGTLYSPDCISVWLESRIPEYPSSPTVYPRKGCKSGMIVQFNNTYRYEAKNFAIGDIVNVIIFVSTNSITDKKTKKEKPYTIISGIAMKAYQSESTEEEIKADQRFADDRARRQAYIDKHS